MKIQIIEQFYNTKLFKPGMPKFYPTTEKDIEKIKQSARFKIWYIGYSISNFRLVAWIKSQYNSIHNHISFWIIKRKADAIHKQTGYQIHVVPSDNGLILVSKRFSKPNEVMSLEAFNREAKKRGLKQITHIDILKMAYYSTGQKGLKR